MVDGTEELAKRGKDKAIGKNLKKNGGPTSHGEKAKLGARAATGQGGITDTTTADTKKITVKKTQDLSEWYQQMLSKGQFISYYDVCGCYILEPASYAIWEAIKTWFDAKIKDIGVRNCYYPVFISQDNLQKEKDHIEGFAAEVAWVTHGGKTKLEKPIAVRPTSETAMYKDFHDKIQSHRDLPLKRNQWNNVVRWEFSNPMPFIRSREFLWQEGHTAHLTEESAGEEVMQILDFYAGVYEELLAVPVVKGRKTLNEQFPGALYTTTIEAFLPSNGRAVQAATSHCLGQHFAKSDMYDISVEDPAPKEPGEAKKPRLYVWQNSWGLSTRSIGVMMLLHGDDKGAVVPPRVAEIQVVLIPVGITSKQSEADKESIYGNVQSMCATLVNAGVRAQADLSTQYTAAWKFNEYELRGVPLRLEFGPKDAANKSAMACRRDTGEKSIIPLVQLSTDITALLDVIHNDMYAKAKKAYDEHRVRLTEWDKVVPTLNDKNVLLLPHCLDGQCADLVKDETAALAKTEQAAEDKKAPSMGAKALCIPFEQPSAPKGKCIRPSCGKDAQKWVQFGRSY